MQIDLMTSLADLTISREVSYLNYYERSAVREASDGMALKQATNFFWLDQPSGCDIAVFNQLLNPARCIALDSQCFVICLGIPVVIAPLDQQKHGFQ